jgi:hypothetical protein
VITLFVGAGYTGTRVLKRLPDALALGRSRSGDERLDLDRDERLRITLPEEYAVIYSVPPASDLPGDPRLGRFLAMLPHPPARFVYLSTTGVYGNREGARVDEASKPRPEAARAERRLAAERMLVEWCTGRHTTAVVLRVPGIYGPGRLGTEGIRSAMPVLEEKDANPGNRIHVDDLATCCIAALSPDVRDGGCAAGRPAPAPGNQPRGGPKDLFADAALFPQGIPHRRHDKDARGPGRNPEIRRCR